MAKDPYKYFRIEARELLDALSQGALELDKGAAPETIAGRLLRLAHTLKGAARVVHETEIAELAHAVEDLLAPHREARTPVPHGQVNALLRLLDTLKSRAAVLGAAEEPRADSPAAPARDAPVEAMRIAFDEVDALRESLAEAEVQLTDLRKVVAVAERVRRLAGGLLDPARMGRGPGSDGLGPVAARSRLLADELTSDLDALRRALAAGLDRTEKELDQARDRANQLRLLPATTIFASLERAARDAAESLQKRVEFRTAGGDVRLDAHVLGALRDALLHVVRNAVAHGIEPGPERAAAGKPPAGIVRLEVERRGSRITFICSDDGRGVDVEAVRRAAVRRGLLSAAEAAALDAPQAIQLLLRGGVTTTREVTEVSGRAVGLDVARDTVARLRGDIRIQSEPGRGTSVALRAPLTLSASTSLLIEAEGVVASIPLDAVEGVRGISDREIARSPDGDSIACGGRRIPFLPLARALGLPGAAPPDGRARFAVLVRHGPASAAVGVDRLLGAAGVVGQALPALAEADALVAGASLDAEGCPRLALDPGGLVEAVHAAKGSGTGSPAARRPPILVVDDSLTTRMLEQSILESAGYEVELAVSAEEALARARRRRHGLFLVDIEMPGMDGFELVERTRADPALRETPAILVTSRGSPEDRRRGLEAGARAYIVKSEFDQDHLLRTIRELMG